MRFFEPVTPIFDHEDPFVRQSRGSLLLDESQASCCANKKSRTAHFSAELPFVSQETKKSCASILLPSAIIIACNSEVPLLSIEQRMAVKFSFPLMA
jgi:hypothetical protein